MNLSKKKKKFNYIWILLIVANQAHQKSYANPIKLHKEYEHKY